ncbi:uncharacterized protein BCR38DRAFT_416359, partial [Pseudomassariella vexata]
MVPKSSGNVNTLEAPPSPPPGQCAAFLNPGSVLPELSSRCWTWACGSCSHRPSGTTVARATAALEIRKRSRCSTASAPAFLRSSPTPSRAPCKRLLNAADKLSRGLAASSALRRRSTEMPAVLRSTALTSAARSALLARLSGSVAKVVGALVLNLLIFCLPQVLFVQAGL